MKKTDTTLSSSQAALEAALGLEALEPRILLDAAVMATGAEALDMAMDAEVSAALEPMFLNLAPVDETLLSAPGLPFANIGLSASEDTPIYEPLDPSSAAALALTDPQIVLSTDDSGFATLSFDGDTPPSDLLVETRKGVITPIAELPTAHDGEKPAITPISEVQSKDTLIPISEIQDKDVIVPISERPSVDIVFIDGSVSGFEQIVDSVPDGFEIVIVSADQDGVQVMADTLAGRSDVTSIHIVSHGEPGQFTLGTSTVDAASLAGEHASLFAQMGDAFTGAGDILIYGCDFGQEDAVLSALAGLTGTDVAASIDDTGAALVGGDWVLEARTGNIEAAALNAVGFAGILADTDGDLVDDSVDVDDDNDGILDVDEGGTSEFDIEVNGTFGTLSGTGFRDLQNAPGTGYTYGGTTNGLDPAGRYAVVNQAGGQASHSGAGWTFAGVSGDADDAFLAVNGGTSVGTFFSEAVTLDPNTDYEFSFFARSGFNTVNNPAEGFNIEMRVLDSSNTVVATLQTGVQTSLQAWTQFTQTFNTGTETNFTLQVRNLSTASGGNDFAIDSINLLPTQGFSNRDTDGDGVFDHLDLDSDNDGIADNIEAQRTVGYIAPNGDAGPGNNGLDSAYGGGLTPVDTDGDGTDDYRDIDSDDEGGNDAAESGTGATTLATGLSTAATDADGDGLFDVFENGSANDGFVPNDGLSPSSFADADQDAIIDQPGTADLDFRDASDDSIAGFDPGPSGDNDGDGILNVDDLDDDNDGILDVDEGFVAGAPPNSLIDGSEFERADLDDTNGAHSIRFDNLGNEYSIFGGGSSGVDFIGWTESGTVDWSTGAVIYSGSPVSRTDPSDPNAQVFLSDGVFIQESNVSGGGFATFSRFFESISQTVQVEAGKTYTVSFEVGLLPVYSDNATERFVPDIDFGIRDPNGTGALLALDESDHTASSYTIGNEFPDRATLVAADRDNPIFLNPEWQFFTHTFTATTTGTVEVFFEANNTDAIVTVDSVRFVEGTDVVASTGRDTDGDGIQDHLDLDSDNDGISDLHEAGHGAVDANRDGIIDDVRSPTSGGDANDDGLSDSVAGFTAIRDTDNDGTDDYLDLDSDDDGIADTIEGRATNPVPFGFQTNDGDVTDDDTDQDGIVFIGSGGATEHDQINTFGGTFSAVVNTDGDALEDYRDTDSDDDGILDRDESGLAAVSDATYADPDGSAIGVGALPINVLQNADTDASDVDYRSTSDIDGDGVSDADDIDDDNDGILDINEGLPDYPNTAYSGTGISDFSDSIRFLTFDAAGVAGLNSAGDSFVQVVTLADGSTVNMTVTLDAIAPGDGLNAIPVGETRPANILFGQGDTPELRAIRNTNSGSGAAQTFTLTFSFDRPLDLFVTDGEGTSGFTSNTDATTDGSAFQIIDAINPNNITVTGVGTQSVNFRANSSDTANLGAYAFYTLDASTMTVSVNAGLSDLQGISIGIFQDRDGDGQHDYQDLDSDNDGISDLVESGNAAAIALDLDGNGTIERDEGGVAATADTDGDGLLDIFDQDNTVGNTAQDSVGTDAVDTDGDGVEDFVDLDSDADGIADAIEARPTADGNVITSNADSDGDGVIDHFDTSATFGGSFAAPTDTDTDGTADYVSTDSDGDGFSDAAESGNNGALTAGVSYADADGTVDPATLQNIDNDPSDVDYRSLLDTDGDGIADLVDIDDDNDGILDSVEGRRPPGFQVAVWNNVNFEEPSITAADTNFVTDATALQTMVTGSGLTTAPSTTPDGNHIAVGGLDSADLSEALANDDYIDLTFTADMDLEIVNAFMSVYTDGANPDVSGMNGTWMISTDGGATFSIFCDTDFDNSGLHSDSSASSNDATIPSAPVVRSGETATVRLYLHGSPALTGNIDDIGLTFVGAPVDTDSDGVIDSLDLDSDNDGISDLEESGSGALDANNDGVLDEMATPALAAVNDADGDGLLETLDNGSEVAPQHNDSDGLPNYLDLDSDDDRIADAIEARPTGSGNVITSTTDSDGDGVLDHFDTTTTFGGSFTTPVDTDTAIGNNGDGVADYIDTDSDGDGILDVNETGLPSATDANGDGIVDDPNFGISYSDADGSLIPSDDLDNFVGDTSEVAYRELNQPPVVDLDDDTTTADRDHEVSVAIADSIIVNPIAANGGVADPDSVSVSQIIIELDEATFLDAADEVFIIGGEEFSLDPNSVPFFAQQDTVITVGGNDYTVRASYVNASVGTPLVRFQIIQLASQGDGQVTLADANAILQSLTYRNDAGSDATAGDRTYTVRAVGDQPASGDSNTATGIISLTDPDPIIDLNDDNTTADLDTATTYTEGDGTVVVIPATADAIDGADNITALNIDLAGFADAGDETLTINGVVVTPGTDSSDTTTTLGGVPVTISLAGNTLTVAATDGVTTLDQAALDGLLRGVAYAHSSDAPTEGARTLNFSATDANGNTTAMDAVATITVEAVNDAPVIALPIANQSGSDSAAIAPLDVTPAFDDPDGNTLSYSVSGLPAGLLIGMTSGLITGTPLADASQGGPASDGVYSVTVTATDPDGLSVDQTFTYTITNPAPVVDTPIGAQTAEDGDAVSYTPAITDPDGDTLSYSVSGLPTGLSINATSGEISGTIDNSASQVAGGVYMITVTADDGEGGLTTDSFTLTVTNPAPDAVDDPITTPEDTAVEVVVRGNDADPDGDDLTVTAVTLGTNGTVAIDPTSGNPVYTPNTDFNGTDTFTYTISDGEGGTDTATVMVTVDPVNDAPIAVDDVETITEDDSYSDSVLVANGNAADSDIEGDTLSVTMIDGAPFTPGTQITLPSGALLTMRVDGSYDYDTNGAFEGLSNGDSVTDSFTYTIDDGNGGTDTARVDINISGVNDAPVAEANTRSITEDQTAPEIGNVIADDSGLGVDSDLESDTLTVSEVDGTPVVADTVITGTYGTLAIQPDGSYSYQLDTANAQAFQTGQTETDSFTYTISDGNGGTDTATLEISIDGQNDAPIAVADTETTDEETAVSGNALPNDTDVDGGPLMVTPQTGVAGSGGGVFSIDAAGMWSFDPNGEFESLGVGDSVTTALTYQVDDGFGGTDTATVTITVTGVNDVPDAMDDTGMTLEDMPLTLDVLGNDSDVDGDTLTLDSVTQPPNGTVAIVGGQLVYTPDADFNGTDSFTYTVDDGEGGTATATVTVTVDPVNDAPVAVDDAVTTDEDTAVTVDVLPNDSDVDGDTLTVTTVTQGTNGTVAIVGGQPVYTPNADFNGTDSFTYTVDDGNGGTDVATVTVTITPVNDLPVAVDDAVTTTEDTPVTVDVLPNDSDVDGDTLTVTAVTNGTNGTVAIVGGQPVYTPNADFNGTDTFTYTVEDGQGGSVTATVTVTVDPVNDAPVAADDVVTTSEDTPVTVDVLPNDSDVDGDTLTVTAVTDGTNGTVAIVGGQPVYTPNADFNGTDTFTYTIEDGQGGSVTATVSVTVDPVNDAPVAVDDTVTTNEDTPVTVDVLPNDSDVDGDTLSVTAVTQGTNGTVAIVGGQPVYTPNADFNGTDSFTYTVEDGEGGSVTATVTVTVDPVNDAPVAVDDAVTTSEDTPVTVDVLPNDSDVDGDTLSVTAVTQGTNGTVAIVGGQPVYTPNADFNGTDSFTYTVEDGQGGSVTATVTVMVDPVNDAPVAADDTAITNEDTPVTIDVLPNDSDVDGDTLSVTAITQGTNGTVAIVGGQPVYTPNADFNGEDTFTYTVDDGQGGTDVATVTVRIGSVNDVPVAVDDAVSTAEDTPIDIPVLSNDSDVDGDTLTVTAVTQGTNGTVAIDAVTGNPVYTPNADFNGTDSFTYTVDDGFGATATATVTVTVDSVNDTPVVVTTIAQQMSTDSVPLTPVDVAALFDDIDGDTLRYGSSDAPAWITIDPDTGELTGTPPADASVSGPYTVTLTATDPDGAVASTTVTFEVANPAPVVNNATASQSLLDGQTVSIPTDFVDPDGDSLTYTATGLPAGLSILSTTGEIVGTLDNSASQGGTDGVYFVTVTADDGEGGTVSQSIEITVDNPAPDAADDNFAANESETITANVILGSDTDPDQDDLTAAAFTSRAGDMGGLFSLTADGTLTFDTNGEFEGLDVGETRVTSVSYEISDGEGGTDTATIFVTVSGTNDAPIATGPLVAQSGTDSAELSPYDVSGLFSDVDGEPLSYALQDAPSWLTIEPSNGVITGTPPADGSQGGANADGVYALTVTVSDPDGESVSQQVIYSIGNTDVVAANDAFTIVEDGSVTSNLITANDLDADGDRLTIDAVALPDGSALPIGSDVSLPEGTLRVNADGTFEFTAAPDYNGVLSFGYTVTDSEGSTDVATVTITVTPEPDAPRVVDPVTGDVATDPNDVLPEVTGNDGQTLTDIPTAQVFSEPDGQVLTYSLPNAPDWLSIDPDTGVISGTPPADASTGGPVNDGRYAITVTATDTDGSSVSTVLNLKLTNTVPDALPDGVIETPEDTPVTFDVLGNDTDADGDTLVVSQIDGQPVAPGDVIAVEGGEVTANADGTLTYTPNADYNGLPSFTYQVSDNEGGVNDATVTLAVQSVPDAPVLSLNVAVETDHDSPAISPVAPGSFVADVDSTEMSQITLTLTGPDDGEGETLTLGGVDVSVPVMTTITVDGVEYNVVSDGRSVTVRPVDITAPIADVDALLASLTYAHQSDAVTLGDRTVSITVTDETDLVSNAGEIVITVNEDVTAPEPPTVNPPVQEPEGPLTVTGEGEPGSIAKVTFPDGTVVEVEVDSEGNFTATSELPQPNGDVTVALCDPTGNESPPVTEPWVDTQDPLPPTVTTVTQDPEGPLTVVGEGEPGSIAKVTFPDGTIAEVEIDDEGNWTATSELPQPNGDVTIVVCDPNGNDSPPVTEPWVDTQDPLPPTVTTVTQDPEGPLTVVGEGEPGSIAKVTFPDGTIAEVEIDSEGNWTATSELPQPNGDVTIVVCDPNGNDSPPVTEPWVDTQDPLPPSVTTVTQDPEGPLTVVGEGEPGSIAKVTFPDGTIAEVEIDSEGNWTATSDAPQPNGDVTVVVCDPNGNDSPPVTEPWVDTQDPLPPVITTIVQQPEGPLTVTGEGEPGSVAKVTFPDGSVIEVEVDADGNWTATSEAPQSSGDITVVLCDENGNESEEVEGVFTDDQEPLPPTVTSVVQNPEGPLTVTGTGEPGSTAKVVFPDGSVVEAEIDADGNYVATSAAPQSSGVVRVTVCDPDGNESEELIEPFVDTQAPLPPTITTTVQGPDGRLSVTGTAEPGTVVTVTFPDGSMVDVPVDDNGNYVAVSETPQTSGDVTAVSTDDDGNVSDPAEDDFVDDRAPEAPAIASVTTNDDANVVVTGTGEPGSTVTVTFPDGSTVEAVVGPDGTWTATSLTQQPDGDITAVQTDAAGNMSEPDNTPYVNVLLDRPIFPDVRTGSLVAGDAKPGMDAASGEIGREVFVNRLGDPTRTDRFDWELPKREREARERAEHETQFRGDDYMIDVPGAPLGEQIWIEAIAKGASINVEFASSTTGDRTVARWEVTQANGAPLPSGVEMMGDYLVIERPLNADALTLQVRALLENGQAITQSVTIDLRTATVEPVGEAVAAGQTLHEQMASLIARADAQDRPLQDAHHDVRPMLDAAE